MIAARAVERKHRELLNDIYELESRLEAVGLQKTDCTDVFLVRNMVKPLSTRIALNAKSFWTYLYRYTRAL